MPALRLTLALLTGVALAAFATPAHGQAATETLRVTAAPEETGGIAHVTVRVEGVEVATRARGLGTPAVELDAAAVFAALSSRWEIRDSILGYWRAQDGAVIGLDMRDGKVRANGFVLGALPDFRTRESADTWLTPNAIAVITGTSAREDPAGHWTFTLDARLKPQFGLDLWIDGRAVPVPAGSEPRTIGPVLLVPLRAVTEAFGHTLGEGPGGAVRVTRAHDSAVIDLDLSTGLVTVNGVPSGVTPNIAYADAGRLILPFTAVETLTGSHIRLVPGSSRIDVTLDARLSSLSLPGPRVADEAAATGFTPERLDYQLSDRGPVRAEFWSRWKGFNTVTTAETVGGFEAPGLLAPRWLSVDVQSLDGWRATVGDYGGAFREFAGTDTARVRGLAWRTRLSKGTLLAVAAGVPLSGASEAANGASTPEFDGFAAGVRAMAADGSSDVGIALQSSVGGSTARVVIGGQKDITFAGPAPLGLESANLAADAGVIETPDGARAALRARAEARFRITETTALQGILSHDGEGFNPTEGGQNQGSRSGASAALSWHARRPIGVLHHLAGGLRASAALSVGAHNSAVYSVSGAVNARLGQQGGDISMDLGETQARDKGKAERARALAVRYFQAFDWGAVNAAYTVTQPGGGAPARGQLAANAVFPAWNRRTASDAGVSLAPSASLVASEAGTELSLGASLLADSGASLGERFRVSGQLAALAPTGEANGASRFFGTLTAALRMSHAVQLQAIYSSDFSSRTDLSVALRGTLTFNEPRRHTAPEEGTGVLKGRVFFDRNRDGLRQADEPGIPSARVSVLNTRLALAADDQGSYTIQNLPTGLYELSLDRRSLPIGFLAGTDLGLRATIGEGRVTTLDVPVIASGQVRGTVFIDADGNGTPDKGETRLEGAWVELESIAAGADPAVTQSAAFGQFAFEGIAPGEYRLRVRSGSGHTETPIMLTEEALFVRIDAGLPPPAPR